MLVACVSFSSPRVENSFINLGGGIASFHIMCLSSTGSCEKRGKRVGSPGCIFWRGWLTIWSQTDDGDSMSKTKACSVLEIEKVDGVTSK